MLEEEEEGFPMQGLYSECIRLGGVHLLRKDKDIGDFEAVSVRFVRRMARTVL